MTQRNAFIDAMRGVAALGVVAIHTAFHSGTAYTPSWFQSLTLLVDVPLFFVLAGWSGGYRVGQVGKTCKSLLTLWLKLAWFCLLLTLVCLLSGLRGPQSAREWLGSLFFDHKFPSFPVLGSSMWFMPVYVRVVFLCQLALCLMNWYAAGKSISPIRLYGLFAGVLLSVYLSINAELPMTGQLTLFPWADPTDVFYLLCWMAGLFIGLRGWRIRSWKTLAILMPVCAAGWYLSVRTLQTGFDLQSSKFPPLLPYAFASCPAIAVMLFLRGRWQPPRWLAHIGQNALFYFCAQGIGGSVLYSILPGVQVGSWFLRWLVMLAVNLALTVLLAEILALLYRLTEKAMRRLWRAVWPRVRAVV